MIRFPAPIALAALVAALLLSSPRLSAEKGATAGSAPGYGLAAAEVLGLNLGLNCVDRFAFDGDYAKVSLQSIERNLKLGWTFDRNDFPVNELGHPYQGSYYFTAARSSGLGFWTAALATMAGSAGWELFCELERPSINDLVTTTMGGAMLGEMLHRLYLEAERSGSPLRFLASPMDAANRGLFPGADDGEAASAPSRFAFSAEAGFATSSLELAEERGGDSESLEPSFYAGESLSYGESVGVSGALPFSYFSQELQVGISPSLYSFSFFSTGRLLSLPLAEAPSLSLGAGAYLDYDFVLSSLVRLSSNAVGLGLAAKGRGPGGFGIEGELQLCGILMSANENVYLQSVYTSASPLDDCRSYDFGFGEGARLRLRLSRERLGRIELGYNCYGLNAIAGAELGAESFDYALVGMLGIGYELPVARGLSLGMAYRLYHKDAFYAPAADVHESIQSLTAFIKWG